MWLVDVAPARAVAAATTGLAATVAVAAAAAGLAATVSVVVALSMPNIYQSTAILAPKSDGGTGGLSRLASQYGGLASLAGINLGGIGGDSNSKPAIAIEKMKSLSFFKQHLYEDLLVDLMAFESWDSSTRQLIYDDEIYDVHLVLIWHQNEHGVRPNLLFYYANDVQANGAHLIHDHANAYGHRVIFFQQISHVLS